MTPTQSEELAAANAKGEISLALRSIADNQNSDEPVAAAKERNDSSIKMLKYGVRTRAYGVN